MFKGLKKQHGVGNLTFTVGEGPKARSEKFHILGMLGSETCVHRQ